LRAVSGALAHDATEDEHLAGIEAARGDLPMLYSILEPPNIRSRLHVIRALYANARTPDQRFALLDQFEDLTLQMAHLMALDLLENGWRPDDEPGCSAFSSPAGSG
jgi:hypothetical protein